ncbi:Chloroperoxidase [Dichotomopilus funicola]|uniref:Chloroperoxidase n=1 Tax=Dichotomopilus funicola TaxID=1934379 RepID=A0AAN6V1T7_9PEZI|nr:Chloroperoxidase [Dichotomopilus funicola]
MKLNFLLQAALAGFAAAIDEPEGHEYHRHHGDSRSPCPGLNVMANHGFLPRSGLNIDLEAVRTGVVGAFNFEYTAFDMPFQQAVDFKLTTTGNSSTFHLADLAKHDTIEFDGSQSRNDFAFGNDNDFDPVIWHSVAKNLGLYHTGPAKEDQYVTIEVAARARAARVKEAMAANKHFNASEAQMMGSPGTTALYLATLWDDEAQAVPKKWIRAFFEEERIPYHEGYNPATRLQKTGADIADFFGKIVAVDTSTPKCKRGQL